MGAYAATALATTVAWLLLGSQAAQRTGLQRELFLTNGFVGQPFRQEVRAGIVRWSPPSDRTQPSRPALVRIASPFLMGSNVLFLLQYQLFMRGFTDIVAEYPNGFWAVFVERFVVPSARGRWPQPR